MLGTGYIFDDEKKISIINTKVVLADSRHNIDFVIDGAKGKMIINKPIKTIICNIKSHRKYKSSGEIPCEHASNASVEIFPIPNFYLETFLETRATP